MTRRGIDQIRKNVVARNQVRLREVQQNQIRVHTELDLPALFFAPLRLRAADRCHHERGFRRNGGGVAGFCLCHQRARLDFLEEVEVVVGCDRVGAEADVHTRLDHAHHIRAAGGKLQIAHRAVHRAHAPLGKKLHVFLR